MTVSPATSRNIVDDIESDSWIMKDDDFIDDVRFDDEDDDDHSNSNNVNVLETEASSTNEPTAKKRFLYYTKKLPRYLRNQPNGNLLRALTLGMEMIQLKPDIYNNYFGGDHGGSSIAPIDAPVPGSSLWVRALFHFIISFSLIVTTTLCMLVTFPKFSLVLTFFLNTNINLDINLNVINLNINRFHRVGLVVLDHRELNLWQMKLYHFGRRKEKAYPYQSSSQVELVQLLCFFRVK